MSMNNPEGKRHTQIECPKGRVKQSDFKASDINEILARYLKGNSVERTQSLIGRYGDVTKMVDYKTALDRVNVANQLFDALPANKGTRMKTPAF